MKKLFAILIISMLATGMMAQPISQLPAASVLNPSDLIPIVQSGVTKKLSAAKIVQFISDSLSNVRILSDTCLQVEYRGSLDTICFSRQDINWMLIGNNIENTNSGNMTLNGQVFVPDIESPGTKYAGIVAGIGIDDRLFPKSIVELYDDTKDTLFDLKLLGRENILTVGALQEEYSDFSTAVAAAGTGDLIDLSNATFTESGTVTLPRNSTLKINPGGLLSGTFTLVGNNTRLDAGLYRCFGDNVTLSGTWITEQAYPEWFGAVSDSVTNASTAINKALTYFKRVKLTGDGYAITGTIELPNDRHLEGSMTTVLFLNANTPFLTALDVDFYQLENLNIRVNTATYATPTWVMEFRPSAANSSRENYTKQRRNAVLININIDGYTSNTVDTTDGVPGMGNGIKIYTTTGHQDYFNTIENVRVAYLDTAFYVYSALSGIISGWNFNNVTVDECDYQIVLLRTYGLNFQNLQCQPRLETVKFLDIKSSNGNLFSGKFWDITTAPTNNDSLFCFGTDAEYNRIFLTEPFDILDTVSTWVKQRNYFNDVDMTGSHKSYANYTFPNTLTDSTGIIYKGINRFIHNYASPVNNGGNLFMGVDAGNFTMTHPTIVSRAAYNIGIGDYTLDALTWGYMNVAVGFNNLTADTTGYANTAIGNQSMIANVSGSNNVAVGASSMATNKSGSDNIAIGFQAGYSNLSSSQTVYIGKNAGLYPTAADNVAVGFEAYKGANGTSTGGNNVAVGSSALSLNTGGSENTVVGFAAMYPNTTGEDNTAIGQKAMRLKTSGSFNTAVGSEALYSNATGSSNIGIGYRAGYKETGSNTFYVASDSTSAAFGMRSNSKLLLYGNQSDAAKSNHYLNIYAKVAIGAYKNPSHALDVTGSATISGYLVTGQGSISDNDATPDMGGYNTFIYNGTANPVTITDFDNPVPGIEYTIIGNSDTYTVTINDSGNFNTSEAIVLGAGDVVKFMVVADNNYIQSSKLVNN